MECDHRRYSGTFRFPATGEIISPQPPNDNFGVTIFVLTNFSAHHASLSQPRPGPSRGVPAIRFSSLPTSTRATEPSPQRKAYAARSTAAMPVTPTPRVSRPVSSSSTRRTPARPATPATRAEPAYGGTTPTRGISKIFTNIPTKGPADRPVPFLSPTTSPRRSFLQTHYKLCHLSPK